MSTASSLTRSRLILVLLLTLLPWPAVWLGMYESKSLVWTFVLYHGVCLLPTVIAGRHLWRGALRFPNLREIGVLALAASIVLPLTVIVFRWIGSTFITDADVMTILTARGFEARWLLPLGIYFVLVNSILEELFWRGVVLNQLARTPERPGRVGAVWTALTFAAWHYLVVRLLVRPGWAELTVCGIVGAGVFFSWLYRRSESIVVPILWHALVFDLPLILIFVVIVRA
jgi:membrane protease YdiL (CAAX protease family)